MGARSNVRIDFTVSGIPQPQGSARAFVPKGWNRAVITSDNKKLRPWRQDVSAMATEAMSERNEQATQEAVEVACYFYFQKPKSTKKSTTQKITKPDIDKLLRGVLDALTGIVFRDDSQVVYVQCKKLFDGAPGCRIVVQEADGIERGDCV